MKNELKVVPLAMGSVLHMMVSFPIAYQQGLSRALLFDQGTA
jgi:hypothetical protein